MLTFFVGNGERRREERVRAWVLGSRSGDFLGNEGKGRDRASGFLDQIGFSNCGDQIGEWGCAGDMNLGLWVVGAAREWR